MNRYAVLAVLSVFIVACNREKPAQESQIQSTPSPSMTQTVPAHGGSSNAAAGMHWTVPGRWASHPPSQMRAATYFVPASEGDEEGAECAVFFFGGGQGGDLQSNIDRWASQFDGSPKAEQSSKEINGIHVTLIKIAGDYLAPSGPMMQSSGTKKGYRLLGAIVDAPGGAVFFKMTGPKKTIGDAEQEFNDMVGSLTKDA